MPFTNFKKSIICESVWHLLNTSSLKYSPAVCAVMTLLQQFITSGNAAKCDKHFAELGFHDIVASFLCICI